MICVTIHRMQLSMKWWFFFFFILQVTRLLCYIKRYIICIYYVVICISYNFLLDVPFHISHSLSLFLCKIFWNIKLFFFFLQLMVFLLYVMNTYRHTDIESRNFKEVINVSIYFSFFFCLTNAKFCLKMWIFLERFH